MPKKVMRTSREAESRWSAWARGEGVRTGSEEGGWQRLDRSGMTVDREGARVDSLDR